MSAARHRLAGAIASMALLIAVVGVTPAWAAEGIVLDRDQVLYGEEGSVRQLAEIEVDADRVGSSCTLRAHTENQFSVHPGNDLLITTGGVQSVIEDVEAEPGAGRDLAAAIVLGPVLLVELRFGPDQLSSMGFDLGVECATVGGAVIGPDACSEPTSSTSDPASSGTDCQDPGSTPVSEVPFVPPTLPSPCATGDAGAGAGTGGGDGSLTVLPDGCGDTTTTTTPTTTAPPATTPPTTAAAAQSTTTTGPAPTVKGLQITRQLPQTPAAAPVQGSPAYTG